nr:integrin beta 5 [Halisarca dujardinii]
MSMKRHWISVASFLVAVLMLWCIDQVQGQLCMEISSCDLCLKSTDICKWCSDLDFSGPRCLPAGDNVTECLSGFESPAVGADRVEDNDFDNEQQLKPQRVAMKIRPGQTSSFDLTIKPAPNFPLDIYFLMDVSTSMWDDLINMKRLTLSISDLMSDISNNFTVGFGSFVDKPTDPFIHLDERHLYQPCYGFSPFCIHPFDFNHHASLTNDTEIFNSAVRRQRLSDTVDNPEGGSDGLLQAAVCNELMGWRSHPARKMLIYITDDFIHFGYDGKLGGAVTPNDGKCHMTPKKDRYGYTYYDYHESKRMDFPSLSMVIDKLQKQDIFPVFGIAVQNIDDNLDNNPVYQSYQNITEAIPNALLEPLTPDPSSLGKLINNSYHAIASRVQLSVVEGGRKNLKIEYESDCGGEGRSTDGLCSGVTIGKEVMYTIKVSADECTPELQKGTTLKIGTGFFGQVEVFVQMDCSCNCTSEPEPQSPECSAGGTFLCGECDCDPGRFGSTCQCGAAANATALTEECSQVNGLVCSGPKAGVCYCGKCVCFEDKGYYGQSCQCNRFSCLRDSRDLMCSGQGSCDCGRCACDKAPSGRPYTGDTCECYPDLDRCQRTPQESPCSGRGACLCGKCTACAEGYSGPFCDQCTSQSICGPDKCRSHEDCINCLFAFDGSSLVKKEFDSCSSFCANISIVLGTTLSFVSSPSTIHCRVPIRSESCTGLNYYVNSGKVTLQVSSTPATCTNVIPAWLIVVPILIGLLFLAIFLVLLVKVIIIYLDHKEYKKWMRDVKASKFSEFESPLYQAAWQTYYCPVYPGHLERGLVGSVSPSLLTKKRKMSQSMPDIADPVPPRMRAMTDHGSAPALRDRRSFVDSSKNIREASVNTNLDSVDGKLGSTQGSVGGKLDVTSRVSLVSGLNKGPLLGSQAVFDDGSQEKLDDLIASLSVENGLNDI